MPQAYRLFAEGIRAEENAVLDTVHGEIQAQDLDPAIRRIHETAFGQRHEAELVDALRKGPT